MRNLFLKCLVGVSCVTGAHQANSQCLQREDLVSLSSVPDEEATLPKLPPSTLPPGWTFKGFDPAAPGEAYWTATDPDAEADAVPAGWLSLRANGHLTDVVFKTTSAHCFDQIKRDLKRDKLLPVPVTCLECSGERYDTGRYTLTLYSGKKGAYPYIIVLHQTSSGKPSLKPTLTPSSTASAP